MSKLHTAPSGRPPAPAECQPRALRLRRALDGVLLLLGTLSISLPGLLMLGGVRDSSVAAEQREPAPLPANPLAEGLDLALLEAWPQSAEDCFSDRFGLRGLLVREHNRLLVLGLDSSPSPDVVVGRNGWLFYLGDGIGEAWRSKQLFTDAELEAWRSQLLRRRDALRARGTHYALLLVPEKPSIYPEEMPRGWERAQARTRREQLAQYLQRTTDLIVVDAGQALLEAKQRAELLYYAHGTHWNDRGAYVAYRALCTAMSRECPGLVATPREAFRERVLDTPGDHWGERLQLLDALPQEVIAYEALEARQAVLAEFWKARAGVMDGRSQLPAAAAAQAPLGRVLLFRDSFSDWLWYFLAEQAASLRSEADLRHDEALIEAEDPDWVIQEIVERHLQGPILQRL